MASTQSKDVYLQLMLLLIDKDLQVQQISAEQIILRNM